MNFTIFPTVAMSNCVKCKLFLNKQNDGAWFSRCHNGPSNKYGGMGFIVCIIYSSVCNSSPLGPIIGADSGPWSWSKMGCWFRASQFSIYACELHFLYGQIDSLNM